MSNIRINHSYKIYFHIILSVVLSLLCKEYSFHKYLFVLFALFLFCSGYGLRCSYADAELKHFWKKKIIGVYCAYFLIEIVTAFVFARNFKTVVLDLLLIKPAYSYGWYMQYLFGCYIVFLVSF